MANDIFVICDKQIKILNRITPQRIQLCERKLRKLRFDELNTGKEIDALYDALIEDAEQAFLTVAIAVYLQSGGKKRRPDRDWLLEFLFATNATTNFIYGYEVERKRQRAKEAVQSHRTVAERETELERAAALWMRQTNEYVDLVAIHAAEKAFEDNGVKQVRWITRGDEKVCDDCKPRHRQIYPIHSIPDRHWHCRCRLEPII